MKTVVMVLCMAGVALAQQRSKTQQEPPATDRAALGKPKKNPEAVDVTIKTGTEIAYDDNFLDLNDKQIKQLEDGTGAPGKFKIYKPEDFVYSVWAEIKVKGRWIGDTTHAGVKVHPFFYLSNSIANYEEYEIYVRQDLGRHEAGIEYQLDRDVYLREMRHFIQGVTTSQPYDSARYMEHEVEPYYTHRLSEMFDLRGSAGYRLKDFNPDFDFRDLSGYFVTVGPMVNLGNGFTAFFRYEFSDMQSGAKLSIPNQWTDPDTSYRQHELLIGGAVDLLKNALELSLKYRIAFREYTTNHSGAEDPDHADRDDMRHKLSFKARYKLSKSWSVRLEYTFWKVDSHRPFADDTVTSEPGNSTRNVISIGAIFAF